MIIYTDAGNQLQIFKPDAMLEKGFMLISLKKKAEMIKWTGNSFTIRMGRKATGKKRESFFCMSREKGIFPFLRLKTLN